MSTRKVLIVAPVPCRVKIRKRDTNTVLKLFMPMWTGNCACGKTWQFHFFGATLGYGLEHLRRRACENGE